ncbi:MAG: hypothetical protein J6U54_11255 [Clostridiales bacterium]|nr:hypothetical protein [Clostridiales bacterium]
MEELIHYMQKYYDELETSDEKMGFVMYMAEAFKRYATVKIRIDREQNRGFEKLRRMINEQKKVIHEVQEKEETDNE